MCRVLCVFCAALYTFFVLRLTRYALRCAYDACVHYARLRARTRHIIVQSYKYYRNYRSFFRRKTLQTQKIHTPSDFVLHSRQILLYLHSNGFLSQRKESKGNSVKVRNSTRCCEFAAPAPMGAVWGRWCCSMPLVVVGMARLGRAARLGRRNAEEQVRRPAVEVFELRLRVTGKSYDRQACKVAALWSSRAVGVWGESCHRAVKEPPSRTEQTLEMYLFDLL